VRRYRHRVVEWGQTVKAFVVVRKGHQVASPSRGVSADRGSPSFKRPESIEFIDALPKNPLGKSCARIYAHRREGSDAAPREKESARRTPAPASAGAVEVSSQLDASPATLRYPGARPTITPAMAVQLLELIEQVEDDQEARMLANHCDRLVLLPASMLEWMRIGRVACGPIQAYCRDNQRRRAGRRPRTCAGGGYSSRDLDRQIRDYSCEAWHDAPFRGTQRLPRLIAPPMLSA